MPGMLAEVRRCFERVADPVACRGVKLSDCLMSGLAVFSLKYPSLLQFEQDARGIGEARDGLRRENLRSLFGIVRAPSDSRMRERLDELDPAELRRPFKRLFALAQRGGALKEFEWLGGRHLLSVDGTGHFSSPTVHCGHCSVKNHKDGTRTYYHQSLCAVLVHRSAARFCRWFRRSRSARRTGRGRTTASGTRRSACCGSFAGASAPAAGGGGGRSGVERAARASAE